MAEKRFSKQKIGFQSILKLFSFNLQMPDKNYDPKSTTKSKDKYNKQRFVNVNTTNRNSYLNIIFIDLVTQQVKNLKKTYNSDFWAFFVKKKLKNLDF